MKSSQRYAQTAADKHSRDGPDLVQDERSTPHEPQLVDEGTDRAAHYMDVELTDDERRCLGVGSWEIRVGSLRNIFWR
jgi:hypothetical protein